MSENYTVKQKLDHLKLARKYLQTVLNGSRVQDRWFADIQDAIDEHVEPAIVKMKTMTEKKITPNKAKQKLYFCDMCSEQGEPSTGHTKNIGNTCNDCNHSLAHYHVEEDI